MTTEEKLRLITRNLEETLTEEELKKLIESGTPLKHYIGFEISGKVHLGTGLATLLKIKDLHDAGAETVIWLADWHGWINNKLDGTLETARRMAREYFAEGMKAAYLCIGGDPDTLIFKQGSELYTQKPEFWATTVKVAKATTISRMMRSTTIMGRMAGGSSPSATLLYPAMQAADIFTLEGNIGHAGTDQRNVHIVARDAAKELGFPKPVAIHHHLLMGLAQPTGVYTNEQIEYAKKINQELPNNMDEVLKRAQDIARESREPNIDTIKLALKMSKSQPDSAVFIHDESDEIKRKVSQAYCPEGQVDLNPILDWTKWLIFYNPTTFTVKRDEKYGGDLNYSSYEELEKDYLDKKLHPQDLKAAVAEWLINKLEPARKYFEDPKRKAALEEIENLTSR